MTQTCFNCDCTDQACLSGNMVDVKVFQCRTCGMVYEASCPAHPIIFKEGMSKSLAQWVKDRL